MATFTSNTTCDNTTCQATCGGDSEVVRDYAKSITDAFEKIADIKGNTKLFGRVVEKAQEITATMSSSTNTEFLWRVLACSRLATLHEDGELPRNTYRIQEFLMEFMYQYYTIGDMNTPDHQKQLTAWVVGRVNLLCATLLHPETTTMMSELVMRTIRPKHSTGPETVDLEKFLINYYADMEEKIMVVSIITGRRDEEHYLEIPEDVIFKPVSKVLKSLAMSFYDVDVDELVRKAHM